MSDHCFSFLDILKAKEKLHGKANTTPVFTSTALNAMTSGCCLFFKCENFQKTGSFKYRGAFNAISSLPPETKDVVTHSSGNHAQAFALAARDCGINAHVVMPIGSVACKVAAVKDYGATIVECEATEKGRKEGAEKLLKKIPNSAFISSCAQPAIMAGQGTMAVEFLEQVWRGWKGFLSSGVFVKVLFHMFKSDQVPDLDAIIASVGGGGMISGILKAAKSIKPDIKVFAAEPTLANDCFLSMQAAEHLPFAHLPDTVADGVRTSVQEACWPQIRDLLDKVYCVDEEDIIQATRLVWERMKLVIETSAGLPVAVVLSKAFQEEHKGKLKNIGIILCGGNVDLDNLPWVEK
eukprot:m.132489 g.132489  ORF g.132489 m.132489 type:complete len:351 (+) comp23772_c0_seq3:60-1112(+)